MADKIVKKLSPKVLLGGSRPKIPNAGETNWIASVVGVATGVKQGESNFGPWMALMGSFVAEAKSTEKEGELVRFRTGQLFMPDVVNNLIIGALNGAKDGVQFGFKIGVIKDDSAATGYTYVAESLIAPAANDPLEKLIGAALGKDKLGIEAPKETNEKKK